MVYDWGNHAFFTLVLGVLIGDFITSLAQGTVGENGAIITLGGYDIVTAKSIYSYSVSVSVLLRCSTERRFVYLCKWMQPIRRCRVCRGAAPPQKRQMP